MRSADFIKALKQHTKDKTILYVEDEKEIREVIGSILSSIFKETVIAQNGVEGLEAYKKHNCDIVLTDVKMKKMSGLEMIREIKKINPDAKFIVTSAFDSSEFLLESISSGVSNYLLKPVSFEAFKDTLKNVCDEIDGSRGMKKIEELSKELERTNIELEKRIAQETKKRLAQEQMVIEQGKMAQMGELIGVIAHQWKQPLSVISLVFHMLQEEIDNQSKDVAALKGYIDDGIKQVAFLLETMNDFRDFLKPSSKKDRFCVCEAIEDVLKLTSALLIQSNIEYEIPECKRCPYVYGYENELKNVFLNLIGNSNDAITSFRTKRGFRKSEFGGKITVDIQEKDEYVLIEFLDNGGGIDEEILPNLFQKYVSSKGDSGTGIGLFTAKTIIEQNMGGEMGACNKKNGACISIKLPLSKGE